MAQERRPSRRVGCRVWELGFRASGFREQLRLKVALSEGVRDKGIQEAGVGGASLSKPSTCLI